MICPSCRTDNPREVGVCAACGGPLRPVAPGTMLAGRYEILAVLGRGGMGTVYSARDRAIDETVALKVLRPEIADSPEFKQRFSTEVRLARRVTHPIVCRIHEYGEDGGLRFLVMELVQGQDLRRMLSEGPLAPERALEIAIQAADGLQAIHAAGIVHRDLKTANLMVDGAGGIKLMDFGIAKAVEGGGKAAAPSGYIVGTPEYMSPEQGRGRPVDARSDIYSLGVVVYELFTGRVPFHADTPIATLMLHVEAPPPLDDPALPPAVVAVLRRALAKDPGDRFPTAKAMADALRGSGTLRLGRPSPGTRHLVLASLVLIGGWVAWRWLPATAPPPTVASPVLVPPTEPSTASVIPSPRPTASPAPADTGRDHRAVHDLAIVARAAQSPVTRRRAVPPAHPRARRGRAAVARELGAGRGPPRDHRPRRGPARRRAALGGRHHRRRASWPDAPRAARGDAGRAPGRPVPPRLPAVGTARRRRARGNAAPGRRTERRRRPPPALKRAGIAPSAPAS